MTKADRKRARRSSPADMVNAPPHYRVGGLECLDVIEALGLDFHLGQVCKYIWRAGRKGDAVEDLRKARFYLDRAIERRSIKRSKRRSRR